MTETLKDLGERDAIRRLSRKLFPAVGEMVGIGDDGAVMHDENAEVDWVLTSDPVIEGTHFTIDTEHARIGHKAVGRVLSDIAAMGADPCWLLINIVSPRDMPFQKLEAVYDGAADLALKYGVAIVGGDMAEGPNLELHVFGVGQVPHGDAVLRSGARAGDTIYVTGELGGSIKGRHLSFEPRVMEGMWLREQGWASAMIDVSDGLATDLRHILEMGQLGADLSGDKVPVSDAARHMDDQRTALDHALYDGEDFELLFTVPEGKRKFLESAWEESFDLPLSAVGTITDKAGAINLVTDAGVRNIILKGGYQHFTR
jgi:thiamine-monophosphate kinase